MCQGARELGLPAFVCIPCHQERDGPELTPPNILHLPSSLWVLSKPSCCPLLSAVRILAFTGQPGISRFPIVLGNSFPHTVSRKKPQTALKARMPVSLKA